MSPILVRPVREQLEHDRIIRLLQAKGRRRFEVGTNVGNEQTMAVGSGAAALYPDLLLHSRERGHRLQAVVEVETGESVNHLEALAQWTHFGKLRAAFHLYVPSGMVDVARRLCEDNNIHVTEIWSYHTVGEEVRFTLVHRSRETPPVRRAVATAPESGEARRSTSSRPAKRVPRAVKRPLRARKAKKPVRAQKRK